jgi:Linear amide C-N hydrolases, choloylglycine hydrolase family
VAGRAGRRWARPGAGMLVSLALAAVLVVVLLGARDRERPAITVAVADPAAADRTLASLRRLDDHPLFTMTFQGSYDRLAHLPEVERATALAAARGTWACSLFSAAPVFGRNFDWDDDPALLLFTDPPDGYASVSMVDLSYLGFGRSSPPDQVAEARRRLLLAAPLLPFDGMNEHGLVVGMAAVEGATADLERDRPTVGSVRIIRLMLDQARTTTEAVAVMRRYNVDFSSGPPLHYLIADATGRAAVVEYVDGRMRVVWQEGAWQAAVNFHLTGTSEPARQADPRYRAISGELAHGEVRDWRQAMRLLERVAQPHTRWSVVYGMRDGEVHLAMGQHYADVHTFHLPLASADG